MSVQMWLADRSVVFSAMSLNLQGGVIDTKAFAQHFIYIEEDLPAVAQAHIVDLKMATKCGHA